MIKLYFTYLFSVILVLFISNSTAQNSINKITSVTASIPAGGSKELSKTFWNVMPFDVDSVSAGSSASLVTAEVKSWSLSKPHISIRYSLNVSESATIGSQLSMTVSFSCYVPGGIITIYEQHTINVTQKLFDEIETVLTPVSDGSAVWGDYDNDGDLDILLTGREKISTFDREPITRTYKNENGEFIEDVDNLLPLYYSDGSWGDYDNDGDLDIILIGSDEQGVKRAKIYQNDGGRFVNVNANITGVDRGAVDWGDFDNDGDLDVLLTGGISNSSWVTKVFRNDRGVFVDINANLTGTVWGDTKWGDYDNDGDLDILLAGQQSRYGVYITKIYRNNNGAFTDTGISLTGVRSCAVAWVDFDSDGDLDVILTGYSGGSISNKILETKVYRNINGSFTAINNIIHGFEFASMDFGDYDNDGDPDLLITGNSSEGEVVTRLYRNDNGVFKDTWADFEGVYYSSVSWGDYDNDSDLDLLITGWWKTEIYRNPIESSNTLPSPPENLSFSIDNSNIILSWEAGEDSETRTEGLSYNVRVGTTPGGNEVVSSHSDNSTGYRLIPAIGNCQKNLSYKIKNIDLSKTYYWSVQTIDAAYAGSVFENSTINIATPSVSFFADVTFGTKPLTVQFADSSTGMITNWHWNFGDGKSSTQQHPSHTYKSADIFSVALTVTGPGGSDTKTRNDYIIVSEPTPIANFIADTTSGIMPFTVQFTDSSTGMITNWQWDFGDGKNSTEQHPFHTYDSADNYTVSLTVTGPGGTDTKTRTNYIIVTYPTSVNDYETQLLPDEFLLYQNYPNPFNTQTIIPFSLPNQSEVTLNIYNLRGKMVATLFKGSKSAGKYVVIWNADRYPSGTYFIRMQAGSFIDTKECVLLK